MQWGYTIYFQSYWYFSNYFKISHNNELSNSIKYLRDFKNNDEYFDEYLWVFNHTVNRCSIIDFIGKLDLKKYL